MKNVRKVLSALILVAAGGAAFAQPGGGCDGMMGGGPMGRQATMQADPGQRAERHLDVLKKQIKPTAEQEPLWAAFADKMKTEAGKGMKAMREQAADDKLTAPERMARMQSMMKDRMSTMSAMHETFSRFYDALSTEQKAIADRHFARMGEGKARGGPGAMQPRG